MKNNLVLIDDKDKYVVECLNGGFEFVHDKTNGSNWFNQKTLAKIFGVSQVNISSRLKRYLDNLKKSNSSITKSYKALSNGYIKLKTNQTTQKVLFYDFKAVTYLAHRINTPEAFDMLEWIDSSLNTMFNVVTGKDSINSNKSWLKQQCEAKQVKAMKYKGASKLLYEADGELDAKRIYSKYKKLEAEALKFKEMYLDYERLDKEVASVRSDKTEQLKLI